MKVSIITVAWNSARTVEDALDSVLNQTYKNIEYIIIDGGSSDGTVEIVQGYAHKIHKFVSEPDKGIYDAMNKGISLATGDLIGVLNSDDFYPNNNVISDVVKLFQSNQASDMVLGNVDFVSPTDLTSPVRFYSSFRFSPWKMRFGFMPAHPGAFIRRSAYKKVGSYKLGYKIGADFEWFVRAFLVNKLSYVKLNKNLVRMQEGGVSTSGLKSYWIISNEVVRALRENSIYSNLFFVFLRLPIKAFHKLTRSAKT